MSAPEIVTFGCRLNAFESEVIRDQVIATGLADTIVFNTCAVTAEAERQARQAIRKVRRNRPGSRNCCHRLCGPNQSFTFRCHGRS